jgi:hypothetical protein
MVSGKVGKLLAVDMGTIMTYCVRILDYLEL